jgi:hypothetical protein
MTYRVGHHQPQNVYRDDAYIGVMFTAEDAALVVEALNGAHPGNPRGYHPTCIEITTVTDAYHGKRRFTCGPDCPPLAAEEGP